MQGCSGSGVGWLEKTLLDEDDSEDGSLLREGSGQQGDCLGAG